MHIEWTTEPDRLTGIPVTKLTNYRGHSHHLYFTNPGWYDNGRRLLFASERCNRNNLYGIDLETGGIEQITDLDEANRSFLPTCVNPVRDEAYYRDGNGFYAVDLHTRSTRHLLDIGPDWNLQMSNCDAAGEFVYVAIFQDPEQLIPRLGAAAAPLIWESRPTSRIIRVSTIDGRIELVHEEQRWMGHVNTSPVRPELISFCYEGPWQKVGQRIWVMDVNTRDIRPVRPVSGREVVGHEYWYADGVRMGYHGCSDSDEPLLGHICYDNTGKSDMIFTTGGNTGHIFSLDEELIVGDGDGVIKCWRKEGDTYSEARVFCRHDSGMRIQKTHPHPRISPDRTHIIFTSDHGGYGNLYRVPLVPFEELKPLK
ncbi:oligogalacturonate lyase family protein [Ruficoccus sp. ZRK36]|uniref:oligogalacturonate lyase family protein n=1 Tax=Ruficoccus sp. ZRK36 TaxID=2866311 RepID=UPI001C738828|nr:oligogalacturonate lyase family protein [Ruficoccus sp. ZRK36]QYY37277.1 oligogalacturonate lyase family protein [Ruficoccus sp. ZRK36]